MGSYTNTPPTFLAGELPDADKFDEVSDYMVAQTAAWTSAAPTWTAGAGSPSVGNGALAGRHRTIGKTKNFEISLTVGSTTTFGTAGQRWEFTLPGGGTCAASCMGSGWFFDTSTGSNYTLTWKMDASSTTIRTWRNDASPSAEFLNNAPVTPATGDVFLLSGTVEIT